MSDKKVIHPSAYTKEWISKNYNAYLKTEHWQIVRQIYAEHHPKSQKCTACRRKLRLNLHHRTYERAGNEWFSDLCYLCEDCHHRAHQMLRSGKYDWLTLQTVEAKLKRDSKKIVKRMGFRCQVCGKGGYADVSPSNRARCLCETHRKTYQGIELPKGFTVNFNKRKHLEKGS